MSNAITEENKQLNYQDYKFGNFKKVEDNKIINKLAEMNKEIFLLSNGKIGIKNKYSSAYQEYGISQAELIITNITGCCCKIEKKKSLEDIEDINTIHISELLMVEGLQFNPHKMSEYYCHEDGLIYINKFKPNEILMSNTTNHTQPVAIFGLIHHLVNYDNERYWYFMFWLARFIQTLEKSQVAIIFKGVQGSGKGILYSIIQKILGSEYCKQINGDSLSSNYLGGFIEDTLFLNFDEINHNTIRKSSFSSFLKALVTNDEVTAEKKNKNLTHATKMWAQVILFSNENFPIEIEPSDRRFTVFTTAGSLMQTNFLNYGSYENFKLAIDNELNEFISFLKTLKPDKNAVNSVFITPEKLAIINSSQDNLSVFHQAVINRNIGFFVDLQYEHLTLFIDLQNDFYNGRINRANIAKAYNALFPSKNYSSREILSKLRILDSMNIFTDTNMLHSGSKHYYNLGVRY